MVQRITLLHHAANIRPVERALPFFRNAGLEARGMAYEAAFARLSVPRGAVIFTDFEFLNAIEQDAAGLIARAVSAAGHRVFNPPGEVKERTALLRALYRGGLNPVEVSRLEDGEWPEHYPVFVRAESGSEHAESGVLEDRAALEAHLSRHLARGLTLKGRIAVRIVAEPGGDGLFRKYGATRLGERIIGQHVMHARDWFVKAETRVYGPEIDRSEVDYAREGGGEFDLMPFFEAAGIDYGRADFGIVDGRPVLYEINPNPTFPVTDRRGVPVQARGVEFGRRFVECVEALDLPRSEAGEIRFPPPPHPTHIQSRRWTRPFRRYWSRKARGRS